MYNKNIINKIIFILFFKIMYNKNKMKQHVTIYCRNITIHSWGYLIKKNMHRKMDPYMYFYLILLNIAYLPFLP